MSQGINAPPIAVIITILRLNFGSLYQGSGARNISSILALSSASVLSSATCILPDRTSRYFSNFNLLDCHLQFSRSIVIRGAETIGATGEPSDGLLRGPICPPPARRVSY